MLGSITSLGERGRGRRWAVTHAWFLIGSVGGGLALGAALIAIRAAGGLLPETVRVVAALAALVPAAAAALLRRTPPSLGRQVDHRWLDRYRGWVVGLGFGFQLGAGVLTRIPSYGLFLLAVAALAGAPPAMLLAAGLVYGTLRGVSASPGGWVTDPLRLQRLNRVSLRLERHAVHAALATDVASAAAILAALLLVG